MKRIGLTTALIFLFPVASLAAPADDLFSPAVKQADSEIQQGHLKEGMAILRAAAATGEPSAEYALAHYLDKGMGHAEPAGAKGGYIVQGIGNEDHAEAARLMSVAAGQGYPLAQLELGWQYEIGNSLPRHPRLARDYFAAVEGKGAPSGRRGAARANAGLGSWAGFAPGAEEAQADQKLVIQDYAAAAPLYRRAAEGGSPSAAYEYGVLCARGQGVAKSDDEARRWLLASAQKGYPPAQFELGQSKLLPDAERLSWLTKASDAGSPLADYWLGQSKLQGRDGTAKDEAGGWVLLRKAADHHETFAKLVLANAYLKGDVPGIPQDRDKAMSLTIEAAEDGNPIAAEFLGVLAAGRRK